MQVSIIHKIHARFVPPQSRIKDLIEMVGRLESLNVSLISLHESIDTSQIKEDVNYDQIVR